MYNDVEFNIEFSLSISGTLLIISSNNSDEEKIKLINKLKDKGKDSLLISAKKFNGTDSFWKNINYLSGLCGEGLSDIEYKQNTVNNFIETNRILVLKDLGILDREYLKQISYEIKEVIRKGIKIVVLTDLKHEMDLINLNPDLNGRIRIVRI